MCSRFDTETEQQRAIQGKTNMYMQTGRVVVVAIDEERLNNAPCNVDKCTRSKHQNYHIINF